MAVVVRMLLSRILALIPLLLGVILFVFIVMRFSPTDPALAAFDGANATAEQLQQFRLENGLLDPLPLQYVHFVWHLLQGDFGTSVITKQPVGDTIATALPLTVAADPARPGHRAGAVARARRDRRRCSATAGRTS